MHEDAGLLLDLLLVQQLDDVSYVLEAKANLEDVAVSDVNGLFSQVFHGSSFLSAVAGRKDEPASGQSLQAVNGANIRLLLSLGMISLISWGPARNKSFWNKSKRRNNRDLRLSVVAVKRFFALRDNMESAAN
ncbi:hypothetical protein [Labrys sp. KNU-23]|uniref:hypothetical protein n=1 Tax=Labrys sp. KNU-23 TaxID=2789216 RepID=UPI001FED6F8E|nr:hypothetical protein [Labrys sp. KNU-23]